MLQHRLTVIQRFSVLCLVALSVAGGSACAQAPRIESARGPGCVEEGAPQTSLPREKLTIHTARGPVDFDVQVAADERARNKGLMFVRRMGEREGMIFDFHRPQPVSFWMHNTYIPLDLVFVRADGRIANIAHRAPTCSDAPIPAAGAVRTVIELNAGTAERLGIRPGDRVTSDRIYPAR